MILRNGLFKSFYVYSLVFLFISLNQLPYPSVFKLQDSNWPYQQNVPLYQPEMNYPPLLIADQNRTVHAFSSQVIKGKSAGTVRAIFYNRWSLEQGWTVPIDILISPNKDTRITDVYLDKSGIFHVVFFGGDNTYADIYYSKAPAAVADNARAWSTPFIIGKNAGDPEGAVFIEDDQGMLNVIYNGRQLGNGVYIVKSTNSGENWSEPTPIFFNPSDQPNTVQLKVIKSKSGKLHAIWGLNDTGGQGRGIYYSNSEDGNLWSNPVLLAYALEGLGVLKPTIIEHNETLFALYLEEAKMKMRRSNDGGKTWDIPLITFPRHVGTNGELSPVIDSGNNLHLFFGQRIPGFTGSPAIHGMWHSMWVDNRWIEPEAVVKGPTIKDLVGDKSFDPNFARAVVSQGNVVLVTWRTDPTGKPNGIWYSFKVLDTPALPVVPLPPAPQEFSFDNELVTQSNPIPSPTPVAENTEMELRDNTKKNIINESAMTLVVALTFCIVFLLIVIGSVIFDNRH